MIEEITCPVCKNKKYQWLTKNIYQCLGCETILTLQYKTKTG